MGWWHGVVDSRHELQNPTSAEKILLLGEALGLDASSRVLDVGAGRGGPAVLLAGAHGCRITCVEPWPEFADAVRERARAAGIEHLVEVVESQAKDFNIKSAGFDAALCIGATFAFDGLVPTVKALARAVPSRGLIAVGEPFWREWPLPRDFELPAGEEDFLPLAETVERFESGGVELVSLFASSQDDWDRFESLKWLTLDQWLAAHPDHPQAEEFRAQGRYHRDRHFRWRRDLMGWAIFVGRVP
jgi:precorrin-6B methylase 2